MATVIHSLGVLQGAVLQAAEASGWLAVGWRQLADFICNSVSPPGLEPGSEPSILTTYTTETADCGPLARTQTTHAHMRACAHVHTCACEHARTRARAHAHARMRTRTCARTRTHTRGLTKNEKQKNKTKTNTQKRKKKTKNTSKKKQNTKIYTRIETKTNNH